MRQRERISEYMETRYHGTVEFQEEPTYNSVRMYVGGADADESTLLELEATDWGTFVEMVNRFDARRKEARQ